MHNTLRIATFNIHKGLTHFNARFSLHEQRELLRTLRPDIVFLQEVRDEHAPHSKRFSDWPAQGQASFLADAIWPIFLMVKIRSIQPVITAMPFSQSFRSSRKKMPIFLPI